jgi:tRNA modification GTPase
MTFLGRDEDTICAVATPPGKGGIAVIRVSGKDVVPVVQKACSFLPSIPESHRVYYGFFRADGQDIDEVLVSFFKEGRSFTGEPTVEISSHGSPTVTTQILECLIDSGARLAQPGEFTYRAFLSGRINLVQAEAVLGLIESQSRRASRLALQQLQGQSSKKIKKIEDLLIWALAHCEANIDFASEDIVFMGNEELLQQMSLTRNLIEELIHSFRLGRSLAEGVQVSILGSPNVGKSSLLNAFLGFEKAIVTEAPGTTRDIVEGEKHHLGVRLQFFDTAGIREAVDLVEKIGIEKSLRVHRETDFNLIGVDIAQDLADTSSLLELRELDPKKCIVIFNKVDKVTNVPVGTTLLSQLQAHLGLSFLSDRPHFFVSAKDGSGIDEVLNYLTAPFLVRDSNDQSIAISSTRQLEGLTRSKTSLDAAIELLKKNESPEFVTFELQNALIPVQEVLGKQFDDDVLDRVFQEFCLGK